MDDLISRQAAIDALDTGLWGVEWDKALATAMLKDLPSAQPEQRWIPVTERLPEDAGTYIICDCYGNVMSRHFCKKSDKFAGYWHANGSKYYGNPTHWMPLPEPPKEEP